METGTFSCQYCDRVNLVEDTEKRFSELLERADVAEKQGQGLQGDLAQQRKKAESLQKTLTLMTLDTELLRQKHNELTAKYGKLADESKDSIATLVADVLQLNGKNLESAEQVAAATTEVQESRVRFAKLSDRAEGHVKLVSAGTAEIQSLKAALREKDAQITELNRGDHSEDAEQTELRLRAELEKVYQDRLEDQKKELSNRFDEVVKRLQASPPSLSADKKKA